MAMVAFAELRAVTVTLLRPALRDTRQAIFFLDVRVALMVRHDPERRVAPVALMT